MKTFIFSGGTTDIAFAADVLAEETDVTAIAVDRGLDTCLSLGISPDVVIGDFDSVSEEGRLFLKDNAARVRKLNPIKDDTDTEAALDYALAHTEGEIVILGGTGTRIDHLLGNLSILGKAFAYDRDVVLLDTHNRIRLVRDTFRIAKEKQFGSYISVFPWQGTARGVTETGFFYPLSDAVLTGVTSLGVSNEIVEEEAVISVEEGVLMVIESRDTYI